MIEGGVPASPASRDSPRPSNTRPLALPRRRRIGYRRLSRSGWLLTDRAVDRFAEEVCVSSVAGGLFDEVQQHPAHRELPSVA